MKTHNLKINPEFFEAVASGKKNFEVRFNDHFFQVGDALILKEFDPETGLTGRSIGRHIIYIYDGNFGLQEGWVILGFEPYEEYNLMLQRMQESIQNVSNKLRDAACKNEKEATQLLEEVTIELVVNNNSIEAK